MTLVDLCFAWNWPYDRDFSSILEHTCRAMGVSLLQVTPDNLPDITPALLNREVGFSALFDRASDEDERFTPLVVWARQRDLLRINPRRQARRAWDKAAMHRHFLTAGFATPATTILPSYLQQPELPPDVLDLDAGPYVLKPAHGGGGRGVRCEIQHGEAICQGRQEFPNEQYLLQKQVRAATLFDRPAWFRILICMGQAFPCWWHPLFHHYTVVTEKECHAPVLMPLKALAERLVRTVSLDLFSTEVVLTEEGEWLVIDYVNDPIDLRLLSNTPDGVPDHLVEAMARKLVIHVKQNANGAGGPKTVSP